MCTCKTLIKTAMAMSQLMSRTRTLLNKVFSSPQARTYYHNPSHGATAQRTSEQTFAPNNLAAQYTSPCIQHCGRSICRIPHYNATQICLHIQLAGKQQGCMHRHTQHHTATNITNDPTHGTCPIDKGRCILCLCSPGCMIASLLHQWAPTTS